MYIVDSLMEITRGHAWMELISHEFLLVLLIHIGGIMLYYIPFIAFYIVL